VEAVPVADVEQPVVVGLDLRIPVAHGEMSFAGGPE
jgi:hypothetical protein